MENIYLDKCDKNSVILNKHFSQTIDFNKLYSLYIKKNQFDAASSLEIDLLENELENIQNNGKLDSNIVQNARHFYNQLVNKILTSNNYDDYSILISNNFYKFTIFFDKQTLENIKSKINFLKKSVNTLAQKYIKEEKLTNQEYKILFSNNLKKYGIDLYEEILKKLVSSSSPKSLNLYEIKFICDYINEKQSIELNYDKCNVYFGYYFPQLDFKTGEIKKIKWNSTTNGGAAANYGVIMNMNHLYASKTHSISSIIRTISHESMHMKQKNDFFKGKTTLESMAETSQRFLYDSYSSYNLYKINYDFHETEFQANYQSYITLIELQEEYDMKIDTSRYEKLLNEMRINHAYSMIIPNPQNADSKVYMLEEYKVKALEIIFQKYPQLINTKEYNSYNYFYNKDGTLKSLEEISKKFLSIEATKKRKEELTEIFIPFLSYAINKEDNISLTPGIIKIIELLKQYEEQQLEIMEKGKDIFRNNINHHLKLVDKRFENTDEMLIQHRKEKLKKYNLLLSQKNTISTNQNETIESFQERIGLFDWNKEEVKIQKENEKRKNIGRKSYSHSTVSLMFDITNLKSENDKNLKNKMIELSQYLFDWEIIENFYKELHNYREMTDNEKKMFDELLNTKQQFIESELKRISEEIKKESEKEIYDKTEQYDVEHHHRRL